MKKGWSKFDIDRFVSSNKITSKTSLDKQKTYLKCANLYVEVKEYKDALHYIQQYIKCTPKDFKGYKTLGYIQHQLGDVKEALKSYRRSTELNDLDKESKEAVCQLYCQSKEQLFRKRAWLEKMEKDMPHSKDTAALKFHVLQESGNIHDLEMYLAKQVQSKPHDALTHIRLIELLNKQNNGQEVFHYCSKINQTGAFYQHNELLDLSFKVMSKYLTNGKDLEYKEAEQIVRTCDWVISNQIKQKCDVDKIKESWRNYDKCLYVCSKRANLTSSAKWKELACESLARLWLHLGSLVSVSEVSDNSIIRACHFLALSAPSLPSHHVAVELSQHRLITAGIAFSKERLQSTATELSAILANHCSLTGQQAILTSFASRGNSYCMSNPVRNVVLPQPVNDHTPSIIHYMRIRPLELGTLLFALHTSTQIEQPVQVSLIVANLFPKLKLHAQSLELIHATDLAQDDVSALLHLISQHPELETENVQNFWNEICYLCKLVPVPARNLSLLKTGLWSVRGLSNHGLSPKHAITLASYFAHCAALNVTDDKYRQRSSHYWKLSYNIINLIITRNYKTTKNTFFKYIKTEDCDLDELKEQSALAVAGAYVADGKYTLALDTYNSLTTPQAAYNASQVYIHLSECTVCPKSKAQYKESAKAQLDVCRDRALATQDQDLLNLVNDDTTFSDNETEKSPTLEVNDIRKVLDFSTSTQIQATPDDTEDLTTKVDSLTIDCSNLKKQLENKDNVVDSLKDEISKLKEEMQKLRSDVVMYSAPQAQTQDITSNNRATPLWMRTDINHSPLAPHLIAPEVPLMAQVLPSHPGALPPGALPHGIRPAAVYPAAQQLIHPSRQLAHPVQGQLVHPAHLTHPAQLTNPAQGLMGTPPLVHPAQGVLPTPPLAQALSTQPSGLSHSTQTLAHAIQPQPLIHPSLSSQPLSSQPLSSQPLSHAGQPLVQPPQQLFTPHVQGTPPLSLPDTMATTYTKLEPTATVFDSSAIKFPEINLQSSLPTNGKFAKPEISPKPVEHSSPSHDSNRNIPGPGYFSKLLDIQHPEEESVDIGGYDSSEEKNDVLGHSQRFPTGSLLSASSSPDKSRDGAVDVSFEKQVDLEEVTDFVTGEEEEEVVYSSRAKLFRFAKDVDGWKERGTGEIKLLYSKEQGTLRLVMRRDFVLNICANHYITSQTSLAPAMGSDKAWVWFTSADLAYEIPEPQQLAARFKTKEIALEFKTILDKYKSNIADTDTKNKDIKDTDTKESTDTDLEIIYIKSGTADQVTEARKYNLPDNFYCYLEKPACSGCVGCNKTDIDQSDDEVVCVKEVLPPTPLKKQAAEHQLPPSFYNQLNEPCSGCIGCEEEDEVVVVKEVLPPTPLKQEAAKHQLPPSFYNMPSQSCTGCIGCEDEQEEEVVIVKEVLPPTPLKQQAAQYQLPPSFYNSRDTCSGCIGCEDDQNEDPENIQVTFEKTPQHCEKAAALKLPPHFFDIPDKACVGCLGCDLDEEEYFEDVEEIQYHEEGTVDEEEENYFGCARSDPNEPVSEKPLYDDLWPEEITEEDTGQFFTPQKGNKSEQTDEDILLAMECVLHHYSPRERTYVELGSGTLTILSSTCRVQFRVYFTNTEQVTCASHAIEGGMYIECVPNSNKQQYIWFVPIDYTDPETPIPRKFMAQFSSSEAGDKFNSLFQQCSKDMKGHVVNHKLVSLLAAGSPKKEASKSVSFCETPQKTALFTTTPVTSPKTALITTPSKDTTPQKTALFTTPSKDTTPQKTALFTTPSKDTTPQKTVLFTTPNEDRCAKLDKSIELVREVLPEPQLQSKETEFQLPKGFYNYLDQAPCTGCLGCEEGD